MYWTIRSDTISWTWPSDRNRDCRLKYVATVTTTSFREDICMRTIWNNEPRIRWNLTHKLRWRNYVHVFSKFHWNACLFKGFLCQNFHFGRSFVWGLDEKRTNHNQIQELPFICYNNCPTCTHIFYHYLRIKPHSVTALVWGPGEIMLQLMWNLVH